MELDIFRLKKKGSIRFLRSIQWNIFGFATEAIHRELDLLHALYVGRR